MNSLELRTNAFRGSGGGCGAFHNQSSWTVRGPTAILLCGIAHGQRARGRDKILSVLQGRRDVTRAGRAADTAPAFFGSGRAGRFSNERLVVDGCTFVMEFAEGDFDRFNPRRFGLYVEGYGLYVQSVRPYFVRNCKEENWSDDSLIDVGFRDTSKKWGGGLLPNHGGLGVVEHCEFADGYVKDSVGLAGGLVFRQNLLRNAWFFPYAFDGGSLFVVGNRLDVMARVVLSGRNGQTDGWTPPEGMLANGGRFVFEGNAVRAVAAPAALFVAGANPGPVAEVVRSDGNAILFAAEPKPWAIEHDGTVLSLAEWRTRTGNDGASMVGAESSAAPPTARTPLPGGLTPESGLGGPGLIGPVGVTDVGLRANTAFQSEGRRRGQRRRDADMLYALRPRSRYGTLSSVGLPAVPAWAHGGKRHSLAEVKITYESL